jgi:hypothetical protein
MMPEPASAGSALAHDPIIVHTMKKVGSSTIVEALRERGNPCQKCHYLSGALDADAERWFSDMGKALPRWLEKDRQFRARLDDWRRDRGRGRCKVITLIRDPVAVNVSVLFTTAGTIWPGFVERFQAGEIGLAEIEAYMLKLVSDEDVASDPVARYLRCMFEVPRRWFEYELPGVYGVDILSRPFPREASHRVYGGPDADILLIKCEQLDACGVTALREFLGLELTQLGHRNTSADKPYHDAFARFKKSVSLPVAFLERQYASPYLRHCYTEAELAAFKVRWSKVRRTDGSRPAGVC